MDLSKVLGELRAMVKELSPARFWALWLVALCFGAGYLMQAIRWW